MDRLLVEFLKYVGIGLAGIVFIALIVNMLQFFIRENEKSKNDKSR